MEFLNAFGAFGYGFAAVLYLLLTILLVTSWRGRMQGGLLLVATFVNALWAAVLAAHAAWYTISLAWIWALESLRDLAWVLFLIGLLDLQLEGCGGSSARCASSRWRQHCCWYCRSRTSRPALACCWSSTWRRFG
jgi:hypothetical protein